MTDNNKNDKTIVPLGSTGLVRVGKSFDVIKKIISQGSFSIKRYNEIKFIPYRKMNNWHLHNIESGITDKEVLNIISIDNPKHIQSFYLVKSEDDKYSLINMNGELFFLGNFISVHRNNEYILCLDINNVFHVFKKNKFICHLSNHSKSKYAPYFDIIDETKIILKKYNYTYGRKYITGGFWSVIGTYNLHGELIELEVSKEELNNYKSSVDYDSLNIEDTFWRIEKDGLYFNKEKKFDFITNNIRSGDIVVSAFHFGYAFLKVFLDADAEFGNVYYNDLGYIDVYGNVYWEGIFNWEGTEEIMQDGTGEDDTDLPF